MIGWLLDTNVISEAARPHPDPNVTAWLGAQPEETLFLSVLTLGEAEQGISMLDPADPKRSRLAAKWRAIEERFAGRVIGVSDPIVRGWGRISADVRKRGERPSVIDTMLAATALEHDFYLATRNTKDVALTGAALFNPWQDNPAAFPLAPWKG